MIQRRGGGVSGRSFARGSGSSRMMADIVSAAVFLANAFCPEVTS